MRNYKMDNLKVFLIFCVILGHMLELYAGGGRLYRIIYSFHMPVFIFLSGYFAKFDKRKILSTLVYPYVLFQFIYLLFDALILKKDMTAITFQFTTPYWLLWYLMAMIFYYMLLPMMEGTDCRILLALVCFLSIAVGFDRTIGYYLTLSRFFTFLPYFVLGTILRQVNLERLLKSGIFRIITFAIAMTTCVFLCKQGLVSVQALYGSYSYAGADNSFITRTLLLFAGINWIFFFLCYVPQQRLPLVSSVGKYTLIPYLMHGFIRLYLANQGEIFVYSRYSNLGLAVFISLSIILIFGNKYIGNTLQIVFTGEGVQRLWRKMHGPPKAELP